MTVQTTQPLALSAGTLKGDRVVNLENEDIGKVEEIMIDINTGRVAYVVISFGGLLGVGSKLFAVPWSSIRVDTERKCFVMNAHKERLEECASSTRMTGRKPRTDSGTTICTSTTSRSLTG